MHRRIPTIEGWGSSNDVQNVAEKTKENNQKATKTGRIINQTPTPGQEHDKIQGQWASDILSKSMLERV
jgi:hypothetical protein